MIQNLKKYSGKLIFLGLLGISLLRLEIFIALVTFVLAYNGLLTPFKTDNCPDDNSEPETEKPNETRWTDSYENYNPGILRRMANLKQFRA